MIDVMVKLSFFTIFLNFIDSNHLRFVRYFGLGPLKSHKLYLEGGRSSDRIDLEKRKFSTSHPHQKWIKKWSEYLTLLTADLLENLVVVNGTQVFLRGYQIYGP